MTSPRVRSHYVVSVMSLALCGFQDPGTTLEPEELGWPRQYMSDGNAVVLYQPQVDKWDKFESIEARMVVSVLEKGNQRRAYGILVLTASTVVNHQDSSVLLYDMKKEITFPDMDEKLAQRLVSITEKALPQRTSLIISLDQVISYLNAVNFSPREVEVNLAPPTILYSNSPALLVMFMGEPKFKQIKNTKLLFASNTNWDMLLDLKSNRYYLLAGQSWFTSAEPTAKDWKPAKTLPAEFGRLPNEENWLDVKKSIPGKPAAKAPVVYVTKEPAELIVTDGDPELSPIGSTDLLYAQNTDSDLFLHKPDGKYYYLVAGRWFRAESLTGPWEAATKNLPETFAAIPEDHPTSHVRASIPGTDEAKEAVILASIPNKATVTRADLSIDVKYDGKPRFVLIKDSKEVYSAANTTFTVLMVNGKYYCCENGVWFIAPSANGPWVVSDSVPTEIYSIPSSSPYHNVTYVYVYDSTPDTVVVGYTSGYSGAYVANGLLMFGAGMAIGYALNDDHWHTWHYHPCYYSYGCSARFSYYSGGWVRAGRYYGPYGGAGFAARYNPITGSYARGGYAYGPYGGVGAGSAYNPVTGARARAGLVSTPNGWAARGSAYNPRTGRAAATRQVNTPYGSWGRSAISNGSDWARFGHRSGRHGTTGGFETSSGAKGAVHRGSQGWSYIGKTESGDVYAGRNGKVYKKDPTNGWSERSNRNNAWNRTATQRTGVGNANARSRGAAPRTGTAQRKRPTYQQQSNRQSSLGTRRGHTGASQGRNVTQQLQRDSRNRSRGNQRFNKRSSMNRSRSAPRPRGGRRR